MALSALKSWGSEILTPTDLNAEFANVYNNALTLISPLTGNLDFGGFRGTGLSLGTAASPSVQFTGDTNTGIYSSGADALDFSTAGVDSWRINSSGQLVGVINNAVIIGGTSTTSTLTLRTTTGGGTIGSDLIIQTGNNGSVELARFRNSGIATIGTPTITTSAGNGDIVVGNNINIRGQNAGATDTVRMMGLNAQNNVTLGGGYAGDTYTIILGIINASLVAGSSNANGTIVIDTTNNRFVYYSGGNRYFLAGTSF